MLASIWLIRRGVEGFGEFVSIVDGSVNWTSAREDATNFDTKADALAVAELIVAGTGVGTLDHPLQSESAGAGSD